MSCPFPSKHPCWGRPAAIPSHQHCHHDCRLLHGVSFSVRDSIRPAGRPGASGIHPGSDKRRSAVSRLAASFWCKVRRALVPTRLSRWSLMASSLCRPPLLLFNDAPMRDRRSVSRPVPSVLIGMGSRRVQRTGAGSQNTSLDSLHSRTSAAAPARRLDPGNATSPLLDLLPAWHEPDRIEFAFLVAPVMPGVGRLHQVLVPVHGACKPRLALMLTSHRSPVVGRRFSWNRHLPCRGELPHRFRGMDESGRPR